MTKLSTFSLSVLFVVFFLSVSLCAAEPEVQPDLDAFVLVGYHAMTEGQNPAEIEDAKERKLMVRQLMDFYYERNLDVMDEISRWNVKYRFSYSHFVTENIHGSFDYKEKEGVGYSILPVLLMGKQSNLEEALNAIDGKAYLGGHFKAEQIETTVYSLHGVYGLYNLDYADHLEPTTELRNITGGPFNAPDLARFDHRQKLSDMVKAYMEEDKSESERRHLFKYVAAFFSFVDESWETDKFIYLPENDKLPAPKGTVFYMFGVLEDAGEPEKFLIK